MGRWIVSVIPQYVSNRVLLTGYRLLAVFGIPRFIRRRHVRENRERLEKTNWNFWNEKEALIENQSEWKNIRFGVGRHLNMCFSGCEIIATFNARKALGDRVSLRDMVALIDAYEAKGAALWGLFGVAPTVIAAYFRKSGFAVQTADGAEEAAVEEIAENHKVLIVTAYHDKKDITAQIHTVCMTREPEGKFVLHNAYHRDEKGRFDKSRPYRTFWEALSHLSGREPKLIYLIGLGKGQTERQKKQEDF